MKSIFLCNDKPCISRVYSSHAIKRLADTADLDNAVYDKSEILAVPWKFRDVEYIFSTWGMPSFSEEEIRTCFPALKCIFYAAGTVRFFAREFLKSGVKVFSAWAANAIPVAETAAAQIVLANKGFFQTSRIYKKEQHAKSCEVLEKCASNYGANVGIIGAGMIGKQVIRLLKNYSLNLFAFDPFLSNGKADELGVTKCDLDFLFKTCSVVSNHLADNAETRGMLTGKLFMSMPPYATFINTGRGAQIVESDLIGALKKRPDLTAILDVTDPEPVEVGSDFYKLDNCILTPHIAGSQGKEVHRMSEYMIEEYESFITGKPLRYEVTEKMLETMA